MLRVIISVMMPFALRFVCVAKAQSCTVGDNADSTRFDNDFVFSLLASGHFSNYIGDYGCFIQTNQTSDLFYTLRRPALSQSASFSISPMPSHARVVFTASATVTRSNGIHTGTTTLASNSAEDYLQVYLYGANYIDNIYGATGAIPLEYQGQEYFASVRANPGLGQVIISSTGEITFVRIKPNGPFTYNSVSYSSPFTDLEIELPAWSQVVITTSSNDFTGSRILANKTVSVVSGSLCAYSPEVSSGNCDYAIEQLSPYDKWGTVFNIAPFADGSSGYYIQITAGRDDTSVTVDGTAVSLNLGQTDSRDITTNTMLRITSDKPIQVVQYLKGALSMVVIPPEEQYTLKTSYLRMNDGDLLSPSHYFTVVGPAPCDSSQFDVTRSAPGFSSFSVSETSTMQNDNVCAYFYQGSQDWTYAITQPSNPQSYFVVIYGKASSAGFAYVGNQKYETQRCPDYHTIIYGTETTTPLPTTTQTTTTVSTTQPITTAVMQTTPTILTTTTIASTDSPTTTPPMETTTQKTTTTATATTTTTTTILPPETSTTTSSTTETTTAVETSTQTTTADLYSTSLMTTDQGNPARHISGSFILRFTDKTVHLSKHIRNVGGPTSQIYCAQQCISTTNCHAFSWIKTSRDCTLSGSIETSADVVQQDGVDIFIRS